MIIVSCEDVPWNHRPYSRYLIEILNRLWIFKQDILCRGWFFRVSAEIIPPLLHLHIPIARFHLFYTPSLYKASFADGSLLMWISWYNIMSTYDFTYTVKAWSIMIRRIFENSIAILRRWGIPVTLLLNLNAQRMKWEWNDLLSFKFYVQIQLHEYNYLQLCTTTITAKYKLFVISRNGAAFHSSI